METRLRNLLHDLATEMPVDVEGSKGRTLRRARGRRVLTAGAGVAVVVALVAVSVSALRFVEPSTPLPAVTGPAPAFEGLWPETDPQALAATQAAVDEGHSPLRTTAEGTATIFATNILGWNLDDVEAASAEGFTGADTQAFVNLSNKSFDASLVSVELAQLGRTGSNGVWSAIDVSTPLVDLGRVNLVRDGLIHIAGHVSDLLDGAPTIEAHVFDGPSLEPSLGSARREIRDGRFELRVSVEQTPDGRATLLLTIPDATGASLGAIMVPVETPVGEAQTSGPDLTDLPPQVADTAQRIYDAAKAGDVDALAELVDPNTFDYNLEPGTDPIPAWRADPSQLDLMVAILEMPPTTREIEGNGIFFFWPYLVNTDFDALTDREREDLAALGYSDAEIRLMIDGGNGYQGPRLAIDETGRWRNFLTVGE